MQIIKPPSIIPILINTPSIFLAGSIDMGKAVNWQAEVEEKLKGYPGTILNPRRDDWDSSWEQSIDNPQFKEQVEWELEGLGKADIIMINFDPTGPAPITLLELGLFVLTCNVFVCCPKGYWRRGNVEIVCERYEVPFFDKFEDLLAAVEQEIIDGYL